MRSTSVTWRWSKKAGSATDCVETFAGARLVAAEKRDFRVVVFSIVDPSVLYRHRSSHGHLSRGFRLCWASFWLLLHLLVQKRTIHSGHPGINVA